MEIHNPYEFPVGSWVVIEKRVDEALGWHDRWTKKATELIGERVKIIGTHALFGYEVEKRRVGRARVPSTALQIPSVRSVEIEVPST